MKTVVDIPESTLREAMRLSGTSTRQQSIRAAVDEFNRRKRIARLVCHLGTLDGFLTADELRRARSDSSSKPARSGRGR